MGGFYYAFPCSILSTGKDRLTSKVPHHGINLWLQVQIFYDVVNPATRRTIDQSTGGKLHDRNAEESRALLEGLSLYENKSWNDLRDFAKLVRAISLPQDVLSTSDRRLIKLENQVQLLMEAHIAPKQPIQVNKVISSCEICSDPHDTQYCMGNPEQALSSMHPRDKPNFNWVCTQSFTSPQNGSFSTYSSSYQTKLKKALSDFDSHQEKRLSILETLLRQQQDIVINKINNLWKAISERFNDTPTRDTAGNLTTQMNFASADYPTKEKLQSKGIKSPSKLLSSKYLSQSSLAEQNRNPFSLKCVYFVNSITILNKKDEAKEEGSVKFSTKRGDGVAITKRRRQDFQSDSFMDLATASRRSQLKAALEDSTWRWRHDYNTTLS
nr:MAK10-like protein [Tanacetum cinerariifolium]